MRDGDATLRRMNNSDAEIAREAVLRTFRWVNGDASFTPVFMDADALRALGPGLVEPFRQEGITTVVSPEARGFIVGALCATTLGVGFLAARKAGFPRPEDRIRVESQPDWRGRRVELTLARVLTPGDRVLLVDDWIETGSQATAIADAITQMGSTLAGMAVIVDQAPDHIRHALNVVGLLRRDELPPGG